MRYRRLSYRYALVFAPREARLTGPAWRPGPSAAPCVWRPRADLVETTTGYRLTVELPGVDPEQVDVLVFEDAVVVEGERLLTPCDDSGVYHAAEIPQGPFRLEVRLRPQIDLDGAEIHLERGILEMCLRRVDVGRRD